MDGTLRTINLLRKLTLDGFLTSDEVWSLGKFFVDEPGCAQVWPGSLLAPMLESAFDDGKLSEEEMTLLAETISSIEQEWRTKNPRLYDRDDSAVAVPVKPALIPVIDAKFEIPAREEETCVVTLKEHQCTCADWQQRRPLPARHPGKCCKHVAHAFTRTGKVFEPWFQALLDDCFAQGQGTNPALNWLLLQLPTRPALVGGGMGPWCKVYASGAEGYENYSFNRDQKLWSYAAEPDGAPLIERAIFDHFAHGRTSAFTAA